MMDLHNFESYIDETILMRGYDYYRQGHVICIRENEEHVFMAEVEGTETYHVAVELDEDMSIVDTRCNCPYDYGEFCKHQVAVFLALRKMKNVVIA